MADKLRAPNVTGIFIEVLARFTFSRQDKDPMKLSARLSFKCGRRLHLDASGAKVNDTGD
jgi:hypothetical protein